MTTPPTPALGTLSPDLSLFSTRAPRFPAFSAPPPPHSTFLIDSLTKSLTSATVRETGFDSILFLGPPLFFSLCMSVPPPLLILLPCLGRTWRKSFLLPPLLLTPTVVAFGDAPCLPPPTLLCVGEKGPSQHKVASPAPPPPPPPLLIYSNLLTLARPI